jgi:hypothetical protein
MNKSVISLAAALLSATALVASTPAQADAKKQHGASSINVSLSGGAPELTVRNIANSNKLSDVQLGIQEANLSIGVSGHVDCTGTQIENFTFREGHFLSGGSFGIGRTSLIVSKALPNSTDINHISDMDSQSFNLSFAQLAGAQIGVNPTALIMAAANQAPNKVTYLRQNHTINVNVPIRWESNRNKYIRNKIIKNTIVEAAETSYHTRDIALKIKYVGDPDLQYPLNAQLINQNQGGGGIQAGEQNFINITGASVIEGIKNLKTKCPGNAQFKVRVTGQGNGHVKIRINDGGATVKTSGAIELVDGKAEFAFSQYLGYKAPGQGDDHSYRIYYSKKTKNENFFPAAYQSIGSTFEWTHICFKPISVGVGLGGNGTIQNQGQQGNSNTPAARGFKPSSPAPVFGKAAPKPPRADTKPARAKSPTTTPVVPMKKLMVPATPERPARATN